MGGDLESIGTDEARSALGWWLEAGVDVVVQEAPRNWLAAPPSRKQSSDEAAPPPNLKQPSHETLSDLQHWLANSAHLPLASSTARRILPHGPENSAIMLLSDSPALEDFAAGQPIGGEAWELASRMLAAIGIRAEEAYSASLSCFYAPGARMSSDEREDCAATARHHIALVGPKRLLLLGDGPCAALLGKRLTEARGHVHSIEGVRTIVTFHPRHLIKRPLDKSLAWQDLLLLMEGKS